MDIFDRRAPADAPVDADGGLTSGEPASSGSGMRAKARDSFIQPQIDQHLDFMEAELGRSTWFAGNHFTAADVQISFPLEAAAARAGLDVTWPLLIDFLARIHARPAYRRAVARGGDYGIVG